METTEAKKRTVKSADDLLSEAYIAQDVDKMSSVDILREVMHFHQTAAKEIIIDIMMRLKATGGRGDLEAMLYKKYAECTEIVIKCAEKLAPYEAAKLQSIEVKNTVEHRFVLRAPEQADSTAGWLKQTGFEDRQIENIEYEEEEEE